VEGGGWRVEGGGWRVEDGGWSVEVTSIVDGSVEPHSGSRIQVMMIVERTPPRGVWFPTPDPSFTKKVFELSAPNSLGFRVWDTSQSRPRSCRHRYSLLKIRSQTPIHRCLHPAPLLKQHTGMARTAIRLWRPYRRGAPP
jgi:hypothetical protein